MDSMKCFSCVLKHLSTALSFGKEVLSGHSKGDELDHRIDFIGEISNAEQHLELIDRNLFNEISLYRKEIQGKDVLLEANDLNFIRQLYLKVEMLKDGIESRSKKPEPLPINPDLVYLNVSNKDFFSLSYRLIKMHLKNYSKIYVLKSSVDLSEYPDVNVLDEDLKDFMNRSDITTDVITLGENMGIIKDIDAKFIFPTFSRKLPHDIFRDIKPTPEKQVLLYDDLKLQPINVKKFNDSVTGNYKYNLSAYHYFSDIDIGVDDNQFSVYADRPICCSIKTNLKTRTFLRWNESAFESLLKELGM